MPYSASPPEPPPIISQASPESKTHVVSASPVPSPSVPSKAQPEVIRDPASSPNSPLQEKVPMTLREFQAQSAQFQAPPPVQQHSNRGRIPPILPKLSPADASVLSAVDDRRAAPAFPATQHSVFGHGFAPRTLQPLSSRDRSPQPLPVEAGDRGMTPPTTLNIASPEETPWLRRMGNRSDAFLAQTREPPTLVIPSEINTPEGSTPLPPSTNPSPLPASPGSEPPPSQAKPSPSPQPGPTPSQTPQRPGSALPAGVLPDVIELTADRQEFDEQRQIFTAEGNVVMRFRGSVLDADRLQVNLLNRIAVAEGQVALTRGEQILRGNRFEYNFVQEVGTVFNASGELYLPQATGDDTPALPTDVGRDAGLGRPLSDRITSQQPLTQVVTTGGVRITVGSGRNINNVGTPLGDSGGQVRRVRFEADQIDFTPRRWEATNVRITNDPFSPPELELRADRAIVNRLSPLRDEILTTRSRVVFDQGFSLPLFRRRTIIDRRERDPALFRIGFDNDERGGLFIRRDFEIVSGPNFQWTVTPEYYLQRAVGASGDNPRFPDDEEGGILNPSSFGLRSRLDYTISARTSLRGRFFLPSLDLDQFEDRVRASLRLRQLIGTHSLGFEYSYRDRLFNGSLGFQTVQSSLGAVLTSPIIRLGNTGINLTYQAGIQRITAETDRLDLLDPIRENDRIDLTRYQASAALNRAIPLWRGKPLPATPNEGLRFTATPVVPFVSLNVGVVGVISGYSNGDSQNTLTGSIGLTGQFGQFSRDFLDYTGFSISYGRLFRDGQSPFLFDRAVDQEVLSFGIVQQIYGPFRIGFQTTLNLETNERISTDYVLEYSRRTYGILIRYNPELEIGSLSFRISDFNWNGGTRPFDDLGVTPVQGGVIRSPE